MYTETLSTDLNVTKDQTQKLKKATQEFEALFMNKIFASMRDTIQDGGLVEKSMGEEVFTEMLDSEIAQQSSKGEGLGLGDMLFESLSQNLPGANGNNFPTGKNNPAGTAQFLELERKMNGTDVASKINMKL